MSVTDSAFIRAYRKDGAAQTKLRTLDRSLEDPGISEATTHIAKPRQGGELGPGGLTLSIYAGAGQENRQVSLPADETSQPQLVQSTTQCGEKRSWRRDDSILARLKGPFAWRKRRGHIDHAERHRPNATAAEPESIRQRKTIQTIQVPEAEVSSTKATSGFEAKWEVDRFQIPTTCERLQTECAIQLTEVIRGVIQQAWQGRNILAITSFGQGEGVTTLAITLAELASSFDIRVALVDGNLHHPHLGPALRLASKRGWESYGPEVPLEEIAIQAAESSLVVVPHSSGVSEHPADTKEHSAELIKEIAGQFELVVLDAGPIFSAAHEWFAPPAVEGIHGAMVIRDTRVTEEVQLRDILYRLKSAGVANVGIIENFQNQ